MELKKRLFAVGILPVIKMDTPVHAVPLAKALAAGGLPAAEVMFRSAAAEASIRAIAAECPERLVCAGTVLDAATAEKAVSAGARCIISPGFNPETVRWCRARGVAVVPGAATPSEVEACAREGLELIKLFPASHLGGPAYLKALAGPYPSLRFMATGGIHSGNVQNYLRQPNLVCAGGSWLVPEELLAEERFDEIEALAREASALRDAVR